MARELIVTENITIDCVIDAAGGWFAPSGAEDPTQIAEMRQIEADLRATADALLVGRRTFEELRGYWPVQKDDRTGVTEYLNSVDKYVVSSTLQDPAWDRTTVLRGDIEEEVASLKADQGGDIVVTGSIKLVHALNHTRLIDEYRLFVYPIMLGHGRRLLDGPTEQRLSLIDAHPFTSGVVLLRYRADLSV